MKTTTLEINHRELRSNKAEVIRTADGTTQLRLMLNGKFLTQFAVKEIDLTEVNGPHVYQYVSFDEEDANAVGQLLDDLNIEVKVFRDITPDKLQVNILKLLDTHWMIYQCIDRAKLRITSAAGVDYYLDYVNGDDALYATHSLVGHDKEDGQALVAALEAMGTFYEVL